jgi:hypothetical protein
VVSGLPKGLAMTSLSSRLDTDHPAVGVGRQLAFGLIQDDQFVAERVAPTRTPFNRNVERVLDCLTACAHERHECGIDVANQNIRLGSFAKVYDKLCFGLSKGEADCFIASPQQSMAELVSIERDRCIKIGYAKQMIVELSK